jgi:hypothetical protein
VVAAWLLKQRVEIEMNSAKTGSLAEAPSADADIARAELRSPNMQPTSNTLSSALVKEVSPAACETPDKRDASDSLPMLNADRQSAVEIPPSPHHRRGGGGGVLQGATTSLQYRPAQ